jgi:hypothetical protein
VGPALPHNLDRLAKAWARESARFERDYNDRLLGGLVVIRRVRACWGGGQGGSAGALTPNLPSAAPFLAAAPCRRKSCMH